MNPGTKIALKPNGESTVAHGGTVVYNGTSRARPLLELEVRPLRVSAVEYKTVRREIVLQTEYDFFLASLSKWLKTPNVAGKFVLIKNQDCIDFFDTKVQALAAGHEHFETQPFFVSQVKPHPTVRIATVRPVR